ncbi:MAG: 3-isopropylmalate dehydratase large subunit [Thaumarchaeota archaeon]|nr:3-isopropylmalate dehydratase large subunit [Nitrososphaerota archaeon]MDG6932288.1 3-isopropylmalate dehydratase large subunit [Nitrososphaerota archaeon]
MSSTIVDKIWNFHQVTTDEDGRSLIYIDRHYTHEVTSPVAFSDMKARGYSVRRPDLTLAVMDHNVPTNSKERPTMEPLSKKEMDALWENSRFFNVPLLDFYSPYQGIIHVIGPELGLTIPMATVAAGDSHTSTHGALGALSFGIGTSEVEHVFVTQTLWLKKPRQFRVRMDGELRNGVTAKDLALYLITKIGTGGALGHIIEYDGTTIANLDVEGRMTLCNMSIEAGARSAIIAPDQKVYDYVKGRPFAPKGEEFDMAVQEWDKLKTDPGAKYDKEIKFDVSGLKPMVTWGTNPSMASEINGYVPNPEEFSDKNKREEVEKALTYMGLKPGTKIEDINVDVVFIGSCTNARLNDLVEAAKILRGKKVKEGVRAIAVPGSEWVKRQAERMGIHDIFMEAGFEWRHAGCSMCIAMNGDSLRPGQHGASTSNRNFENRQGVGGRTHLVSPSMAAAAAIYGHFVDVSEMN